MFETEREGLYSDGNKDRIQSYVPCVSELVGGFLRRRDTLRRPAQLRHLVQMYDTGRRKSKRAAGAAVADDLLQSRVMMAVYVGGREVRSSLTSSVDRTFHIQMMVIDALCLT